MARIMESLKWMNRHTSSHSAPAVNSPTRACETPILRETMAVWSMNLSAPNSRRKRAEIKVQMLKATVSAPPILCEVEALRAGALTFQSVFMIAWYVLIRMEANEQS